MKLVGFTTVNGNETIINPHHVVAVHTHGLGNSEIELDTGTVVTVKGYTPFEVANLLSRHPDSES